MVRNLVRAERINRVRELPELKAGWGLTRDDVIN